LVLGARVGIQVLVRRVPSVRQTRMSAGRRVVRVVVILRDMMPPGCIPGYASGGDEEGVPGHVVIPVAVGRGGALRGRGG
jgi:hypothetical protein